MNTNIKYHYYLEVHVNYTGEYVVCEVDENGVLIKEVKSFKTESAARNFIDKKWS
jgi:hypothetical protein